MDGVMVKSEPDTCSDPPLPTTAELQPDITNLYDRVVVIHVGSGDASKTFDIHREFLKFYSGYFRKTFKELEEGAFGGARSNITDLHDEDPATFAQFHHWLYARDYSFTPRKGNPLCLIDLVKLWCFGQSRMIPLLQNHAMDKIISLMAKGCIMKTSDLHYVYVNTETGSKLRLIVVYYLAHIKATKAADIEWPSTSGQLWFTEFATELVLAKFTEEPIPDIWGNYRWDKCKYHVHGDEKPCNAKGWD